MALLATAASLAPLAGAWAQATAPAEAGVTLDDVIVTAQKRSESVQDVPISIQALGESKLHLGLIRLVLPNATIVDARRHPLACCFSNFKQHFARGQAFAYDLEDLGRYYRDYVRLTAHFDAVLPGHVCRVLHEDMVEDAEAEVRRLLAHANLPFDEACLHLYRNDRAVRTPSSEQVRQPIFKDGLDQWRHFEPWLEPLRRALGDVSETYPAVPASLL